MSWNPKASFSGVMEDVVVPNVMAIVEDNFALALDYYYPAQLLPTFREITLGQVRRKEYPYCAVGPGDNLAVESEDSARLTQPLIVQIRIGVVADTADAVTELIMKYVKVMHGVLITATKADYFGDSNERTFGFSLNVEHIYGSILSNNSILLREAALTLTLNFESR